MNFYTCYSCNTCSYVWQIARCLKFRARFLRMDGVQPFRTDGWHPATCVNMHWGVYNNPLACKLRILYCLSITWNCKGYIYYNSQEMRLQPFSSRLGMGTPPSIVNDYHTGLPHGFFDALNRASSALTFPAIAWSNLLTGHRAAREEWASSTWSHITSCSERAAMSSVGGHRVVSNMNRKHGFDRTPFSRASPADTRRRHADLISSTRPPFPRNWFKRKPYAKRGLD